MLAHESRLPFSLDPLMKEAKRRMRKRRVLVAALAVALAAGVTGATLALREPSGGSHTLATGGLSNVAFRYPASWSRVNWTCWIGPLPEMLLFTTARPTPTCRDGSFPPREQLGPDGIAVWFVYPAPPLNVRTVTNPNTRIGGQPAHISNAPVRGLGATKWVACTSGAAPGRPLGARIQYPGGSVLKVAAVVCGPDYAKGEAAVRRMLASLRFTRSS
jgi:hypothetical protein